VTTTAAHRLIAAAFQSPETLQALLFNKLIAIAAQGKTAIALIIP
jgi:hypothetical protein